MAKRRISEQQACILEYLEQHAGEWLSPTEIGRFVGGGGRHSSWASPKCKKLVSLGMVERSDKGWYRFVGENDNG